MIHQAQQDLAQQFRDLEEILVGDWDDVNGRLRTLETELQTEVNELQQTVNELVAARDASTVASDIESLQGSIDDAAIARQELRDLITTIQNTSLTESDVTELRRKWQNLKTLYL